MSYQRFEYLFTRYVEQRCTAAEREELMEMMSEAKYDRVLRSLLRKTWHEYQASHHLDEDKARLIYEKIFVKPQPGKGRPLPAVRWWRPMAAALVVGAMVTGLLFHFNKNVTEKIAYSQPAVQAGTQHRYIRLPDGSSVILHAGSTLSYANGFTDTSRTVTLTGQAYFDIVHDQARPFRVLTGQLVTKVLGTAFNIKAEPNEEYITVTVTRGRVQVSDGRQNLGLLRPNQQVIFNRNSRRHTEQIVQADSVINWQQHDLFFDNVTMEEAAAQLEYRFGLTIHFADNRLRQCRFTGTFPGGENVEKVLKVICAFNNASYSISGNEVTISGQGCK